MKEKKTVVRINSRQSKLPIHDVSCRTVIPANLIKKIPPFLRTFYTVGYTVMTKMMRIKLMNTLKWQNTHVQINECNAIWESFRNWQE